MFARLVYESFRRQKRRKLLAGVAITLGVGVATAMIAVATDSGDTKSLTLLGTYFSKQLRFGKEDFVTGVRATHPWWKARGAWPDDNSQDVLLGERIATKLNRGLGEQIEISGQSHRIAGILS